MNWPYRRFLKAFDAFQRRILCDEWRARKSTHICALYSNSNLDDERNDRPGIIARLEEEYDRLIARIWNNVRDDEMSEEDKEAWESPFMQAGRKSLQSSVQPIQMPGEAMIESLPG